MMTITGSQARKIGRLSALRPDRDILIEEIGDDGTLTVKFLDEYGLKVERGFVVRENGWSNPSVSRAREEITHA